MSDLLFDIPEVLSPRLAWLKKHGVRVGLNTFTPTHSDDFRFGYKFRADSGSDSGYGNTEDEAIVDFAKKSGLPLWNEEKL